MTPYERYLTCLTFFGGLGAFGLLVLEKRFERPIVGSGMLGAGGETRLQRVKEGLDRRADGGYSPSIRCGVCMISEERMRVEWGIWRVYMGSRYRRTL